MAKRRTVALDLTEFDQTLIRGSIRLENNGVLVMQTPFDRGWRAFQDGKPVSTVKVDAGLLGVDVDKGEHQIEVRYRNPLLFSGAAASLMSLFLLILIFRRYPQLKLQ